MARLDYALLMASGLLAGAATLVTAQNATQADSLHSLMIKAGKLYFGTAADADNFNDAQFADITATEFGMITAYSPNTWNATQTTEGKFSYTNADEVVAKATENRQLMRCHVLVWHKDLPTWGRPSFLACLCFILASLTFLARS